MKASSSVIGAAASGCVIGFCRRSQDAVRCGYHRAETADQRAATRPSDRALPRGAAATRLAPAARARERRLDTAEDDVEPGLELSLAERPEMRGDRGPCRIALRLE